MTVSAIRLRVILIQQNNICLLTVLQVDCSSKVWGDCKLPPSVSPTSIPKGNVGLEVARLKMIQSPRVHNHDLCSTFFLDPSLQQSNEPS